VATKNFIPFVTDFPKPKPVPKVTPIPTGARVTTVAPSGRRLGGSAGSGGILGGIGPPVNPTISNYYGQPIYDLPNAGAPGAPDWPDTVNFNQWANVPGVQQAEGTPYGDPESPYGRGLQEAMTPPGYWTSLFDDPMYQLALANWNSRLGTGRGNLRDQIRTAVINAGVAPKFSDPRYQDLAQYADDLDQNTIDLATNQTANPGSQKAALDRNYQQGLTNLAYQLAGRGTGSDLYGGANTIRTGLLNTQNDIAQNQLVSSLVDSIRGNVSSYNTLQDTEGTTLRQALADVANRLGGAQGPVYGLNTADPGGLLSTRTPTEALAGKPVTWGNRTFTSKSALSAFLDSVPGGMSPEMWARYHPTAWASLS